MNSLNTVGIIGIGNMGTAIAEGLATSADWPKENIYLFDVDAERKNKVARRYNLQTASTAEKLASQTDFVILAVKPDDIEDVLKEISGTVQKVVSIAAGVEIDNILSHLSGAAQVIRIMPNTPCQVKKGMSFIAPGRNVQSEFLDKVQVIFENLGTAVQIKESLMDSATALGGSGPAYIFYFLEALQEAGIYLGFDSETSLETVLQVMEGAVKMVEETGKSPARLRQEVSSPGGTTVEALKLLDERGTRGIIGEALRRARDKSKQLDEQSSSGDN